ncbi:peptidoglycan recognition family protein [Streptomyces anulatus]|uniref:peptidoglycan recognition protein family protein n=1 Tax=Streptomyces anulatus TaxID=1892 RepID=UPI00342BDDBD
MKLVTRSQLGWPTSAAPSQSTARGVKVHYEGTAVSTKLLANHDACLNEWKSIRRSHLANTAENYSDVAYNFAACPHGYLLEGRGLRRRTGANGNAALNQAHYAVLGLVGSSGLTEPTDAMLGAIRDGIELLRKNGAGNEIRGHRDGYATACPGGPLYAWVKKGAPRPTSPTPSKPAPPAPTPAPAVPVEDPMPAPTTLHESVAGGPDLPAGEWTELPAAEDTAILRGPCTYDVAFTVALSGTGDASRVQFRFVHVDIATRRRSAALPVDVYVRGGDTGTQVSRRGSLPAGQYLKVEALAEGAGAAVIHRTVDGLVWR